MESFVSVLVLVVFLYGVYRLYDYVKNKEVDRPVSKGDRDPKDPPDKVSK